MARHRSTQIMRDQIAQELGILPRMKNDPGSLTVREAGLLGGNVVRSLVKKALADAEANPGSVPVDIADSHYELAQQIAVKDHGAQPVQPQQTKGRFQ